LGKLIEFYRPVPRPKAEPVVEEEPTNQVPAIEVLRTLLEKADGMRDVLVLMRDDNDTLGLVSNLEGMPECLLLIEQTKMRMLKSTFDDPKGIA